ncbi:hypothetical protein F4805DRAFT_14120 [Annulohypoxylon moriforme]|nr:hypothetical protein F4805DRAFT_14120 [Annulohypoxylon moriforme]
MMEQINTAQPTAGHTTKPPESTPYILQPVLPHSTWPMIPSAPYCDIAEPDAQQQKPGRSIYNLDSKDIGSDLTNQPISDDCTMSCSFEAAPLARLGIKFRKLSDYGEVIEEGPDKLVIKFMHRLPESLLTVIKQAWVTKYVDSGVQCRMHFGPLIQYEPIEMKLERIKQPPPSTSEDSTPSDAVPSTKENSTDDSTDDENPVDTTSESDFGSGEECGIKHPDVNYDYFGEYRSQFVQRNIIAVVPVLPQQMVYPIDPPQQDHDTHENKATHVGCRGHHQGHQDHQGDSSHHGIPSYQKHLKLPVFPDERQAYCDNQGYQGNQGY